MSKKRAKHTKTKFIDVSVEAMSILPDGSIQVCFRDLKTFKLEVFQYSTYEPTLAVMLADSLVSNRRKPWRASRRRRD